MTLLIFLLISWDFRNRSILQDPRAHNISHPICVDVKVLCEKRFFFSSVFATVKTVIITPLPSQIQATKGLPKVLQCGVQKDPDITVKWTWTKDGSPVDVARMTVQADGSLRITTVQEKDAGTYTCRVESVAGNAATSGTLSVQGKHVHYNLLLYFCPACCPNELRCVVLLDNPARILHLDRWHFLRDRSLKEKGNKETSVNFPYVPESNWC